MRTIIERQQFQPKFHKILKKLWEHAYYEEYSNAKREGPGSVQKYRLRKKYPLPQTISDGEATSYGYKV